MGDWTHIKNKPYSNQVRDGFNWEAKPVFKKGKVGAKLEGEFRKRLGPGVLRVKGTLNPFSNINKGKICATYSIKW